MKPVEAIVAAKLGDLADRLTMVRKHRKTSPEAYEHDAEARDLVAFNLMLAVQVAADLAVYLLTAEGLTPAKTVGDSFERVANHQIIGSDLAACLRRAVGFRNVVAHGYAKLNLAQLHDAAEQGAADLEQFAVEVARWVQGTKL